LQQFCEECRLFRDRAGEAISRQLKLQGKYEVARISNDRRSMEELTPLINAAQAEREAALAAYREHRKLHEHEQAAGIS
jgi:hypothetical protein